MSGVILTILNAIHRLILLVGRFIFKNWVYGEKGQKIPSITNPLLLEPATVLAKKIRTREISSVELMKACIDRVKEINPIVNCVVDERYSQALKEADEVDKYIASGVMTIEEIEKTKPFLGVPVTTKDCIAVKGLLNTSGWFYRKDVRAEEDAPVIQNIKKAGAIPFCVTNVPELCMWYETNNVIFGRTKNPYDTFRMCGGSSGGEAVLQASGGSPFGIGSDIGGSIRMPAFFNGIFGHKPSRFIVPNELQYPSAHTPEEEHMLSTGPMCKFACDLKPMLKALVHKEHLEVLRLDEPVDVEKLKVYYQENDLGGDFISPVDEDIQIALKRVVEHFKNNLKVEVNRAEISRTKDTIPIWLSNMKASGSVPFSHQLSPIPNEKVNQFVELGKMIFSKSNHTLIALLSSLKEDHGIVTGSPEHVHFLEERDKLIEEFKEILKDDMSVFLYPTHPCVAPYHNEAILRPLNFSYTGLINLLGMPSCNVPLGLGSEGLPLGIQVVANYNNDRLCLAVASELEKAFGGWVAP